MSRTINSNNLAAAQSEKPWIIDFAKITIDPDDSTKIVRLTTHYQNITFSGDEYLAAGQFLGFSNISDDLEAKDNGLNISLSGVQSMFTSVVLDNNIEGSPVEIYRGYFNKDTGLLVANPELRWAGSVNNYSIVDDHETGPDDLISIAINCKSLLTTLLDKVSGRFTSSVGISDKSMQYVPALKDFNPAFGKEE